ncbi:hypothetical protein A3A76_02115 [Candidatus Woesebacteria bacterium RIFCSPLOWO2_01_FULL_39_23]|uniref:Uncharacterized protein n=1 Tax=Candidatus Woesebacteria bacterium RIFCSPHIGHO2_01_FULL_40_22 TaxID=1802499 RepID=A0A1F7YFT0_9BACT|nr:MAG: hypothetical protein A2141_03260 [Candidatus Woesebacteria bacterium RBG_16_40_11]OGM26194.1 MAG: hypothetical protein A2628_02545 [Candidatus Woesebacteria bacterium RIFCSPHIGHO2_01_FULL_40_22]OGM37981.1 MAG: hypothetical protein A3E41_03625 [Candidatus Woesebacteria bacterium RIFCSPHIGHO2_12_FULL_38_9]OGM62353.1 MAG: hypothetical protein A3A76_02115 [Candidatus Woesebacteria bacterium RIFCSPLOWO2_01_FULL_39_23]
MIERCTNRGGGKPTPTGQTYINLINTQIARGAEITEELRDKLWKHAAIAHNNTQLLESMSRAARSRAIGKGY